jgi:hypothetical protein
MARMKAMTNLLKTVFMLILGLSLIGCGDSKLDTSDAVSFVKSVEDMYKGVEGKEREDFSKYFFIAMNGRSDLITLSQLNYEEIPNLDSFFNVMVSRKKPDELSALHGLSAEEVVELGRNLKITYLDGRIQELRREIGMSKDAADFFLSYMQESEKVRLSLPSEVTDVISQDGIITEVHIVVRVSNDSAKRIVALAHDDVYLELRHGEDQKRLGMDQALVVDAMGEPVFENGGIPSASEIELRLVWNVDHFGWRVPAQGPITVRYPATLDPCLEGWEQVFQAEDSYRRVFELERSLARLSQQMSETKA